MKTSNKYFILIILDILLIIMWPIVLFTTPFYGKLMAFLIGVVWADDWRTLVDNIRRYKMTKANEE